MPQKEEHLKKARHNEEFLDYIASDLTQFLDWKIIGIFYTTVHYIEAFLATKLVHPTSSGQRQTFTGKYLDAQVYKKYRLLETNCVEARYYNKTFSQSKFQSEMEPAFNFIKEHILGIMI